MLNQNKKESEPLLPIYDPKAEKEIESSDFVSESMIDSDEESLKRISRN
jgi:hypothetical protein